MKSNKKKDYLKHWRVVRYFFCKRYEIKLPDLEMLLFLYTEEYFTKDKFNEFGSLMSFDTKRFARLVRDGYIESFRSHMHKRKALYNLTYKTKRMIASMYNKLDGTEPLPTTREMNPLMLRKNMTYMGRQMKKAVARMNESILQQQRHAPESPYGDSPQ